jgi:phosphotriesterase-related protein
MKSVNTVLGPMSLDDMGKTLIHEHVTYGYPGWYGDLTCAPFDREEAAQQSVRILEDVKQYGLVTYVDATPNESCRDPELMKMVSERSGVNIICSTGYYYESEGAAPYWNFRRRFFDADEEVYEMFMREITEGIGKTGVKAGAIKLATSPGRMTDYEALFFRAAARAQQETGVPILTHTSGGTMGPEQADFLIEAGVSPKQILIGHMCDNLSTSEHLKVLSRGVYDGFDRMGLEGIVGLPMPTDAERYPIIIGLIGTGHIDRIMLSHDHILFMPGRQPFQMDKVVPTPNYYPTHVFNNVAKVLKDAGVTDEQLDTIFVKNPRNFFAGE